MLALFLPISPRNTIIFEINIKKGHLGELCNAIRGGQGQKAIPRYAVGKALTLAARRTGAEQGSGADRNIVWAPLLTFQRVMDCCF